MLQDHKGCWQILTARNEVAGTPASCYLQTLGIASMEKELYLESCDNLEVGGIRQGV